MPIAQCTVSQHLNVNHDSAAKVYQRWQHYSSIYSDDMSVVFTRADGMAGQAYHVIAQLYLPSIWNEPQIQQLGTGLSQAIIESFGLEDKDVIVLIHILQTARVVDGNQLQEW
ncbi:hypothetical protein [Vibrio sp. SCSIO 43136]|uniref:hypothetical protein n=1 Tax=Vibrio sp. SCSIO 43136 TaxID=2819101 RepID=UPI0020762B22|nr:hypothetical protein [Vibrio sp. SCSIO 43136]USD68181.1 hypothetical protein J4N39_18605 [Vibrio sp. SCSIO 43136]